MSSDLFVSGPRGLHGSLRTIARVLAVLTVLGAGLTLQVHGGRAAGLSPDQRHLEQILAQRHFWMMRLKSEQHKEWVLQGQLLRSQKTIGYQQWRLQAERDRAAWQQAQLLSAIQSDQLRVESVRQQLAATRAEYQQVHAQSAGLLERLRKLKSRVHREVGNVSAALVQIYDLSQVSPLETVLEAHSLTDLLKEQNFVSEIGQRDNAVLAWARAEHAAVYSVAKVYIDKMRELRALQGQEKLQLQLVVVETQREDVLLLQAQRLTQRRQQSISRIAASIQMLARQEQQQLHDRSVMAQTDAQMVAQQQREAEYVAVIIGEQTGNYPSIGGPPGVLEWPVQGPISQGFGPSPYPFEPSLTYHGVFYPHFHTGLDIAAPFESPIHAAAAGRVIFAGFMVPGQPHIGYGLCVIIEHTQHLDTLYAHLDNSIGLKVQVGDIVTAGQVIGYEGMTGNTTGPHLHFEVRVDGQFVNPLGYLPSPSG